MNIYYTVSKDFKLLEIFNSERELLYEIDCQYGEPVLETLESWLEEKNISITFDQLIPL